MSTTPRVVSQNDRSPELDLLRFIAASAVVFYHYTYLPGIHGVPSVSTYPHLQHVSLYGYLEVPLFYLISGFVIVWSAHGRTVGQFVLARFKRLARYASSPGHAGSVARC